MVDSAIPYIYDVFIAHAGGDTDLALELYHLLKPTIRVFIDAIDLLPGAAWDDALKSAQKHSRVIAVLISRKTESAWYEREEIAEAINLARTSGHWVVPIYMIPRESLTDVPYGLRRLNGIFVAEQGGLSAVAERVIYVVHHLRQSDSRSPAEDPSILPSGSAPTRTLGERREAARVSLPRELDRALVSLENAKLAGSSITEAQAEVVRIKRALRQGGELLPGDVLGGRYRLGYSIGKGGFASVWKAVDRSTGHIVAVKVLHQDLARDTTRRERFLRGAKQMRGLEHPCIAVVHEIPLPDDGLYYFAMEYVPGGDLRGAILERRLPVAESMKILLAVCDAVEFSHRKGVVHRDIKPANILLTSEGRPKLTDFDLVRAADTTGGTRTGALGTFIYTAPETLDNASTVTVSADVFSLGMTTLFCIFGGELPGIAFRRPEQFVDRLDCPERLKRLILRAVHDDPSSRYPTVADLKLAIESVISGRDDERESEVVRTSGSTDPWETVLRQLGSDGLSHLLQIIPGNKAEKQRELAKEGSLIPRSATYAEIAQLLRERRGDRLALYDAFRLVLGLGRARDLRRIGRAIHSKPHRVWPGSPLLVKFFLNPDGTPKPIALQLNLAANAANRPLAAPESWRRESAAIEESRAVTGQPQVTHTSAALTSEFLRQLDLQIVDAVTGLVRKS